MPGPRSYRVWDPFVRVAHWTLVVTVAAAWLTKEGWGRWHEWIGYAALAIVASRVAWGWAGPKYARFAQFVRSPMAVLRYAGRVFQRTEPRYVGHNPLGGWMILALIANIVLVGITGWLYTTDAYWGVQWVEQLHDALAKLLLGLVALHVAGVIAASIRHRENLAAAMVDGYKHPPGLRDEV